LVRVHSYATVGYKVKRFREMPYGFYGCCSRISRNNREINREFFATTSEIIKFCPKSENLVLKQGISRDFLDISANQEQ
jgi:hypothetical protein